MNDQQIEQEIQAKGLTAPRVTPDMITAAIASSDFHVLPGTQITVCTITLRNGAKVLGYLEPEGYALRERMAAAAAVPALRNAVTAMRAFLDPEDNMPADTGEFRDLKAALVEAEAVLGGRP